MVRAEHPHNEPSAARDRLIGETAELFHAGASHEAALLAALRCAVPDFADWCVVDYYDARGELAMIHSGYPDVRREALILEIRRRYRAERGENGDVLAALESGEPLLYPDMAKLGSVRLSADETQLLAELDLRSSVVVPMHAGGKPLGVVSFVSMRRQYGEKDLAAAQEFAAGCAQVLSRWQDENAIRRSLALVDALYASAPVALGFVDCALHLTRINERFAALSGMEAAAHIGRTMPEVLGPLGDDLQALCRRVLVDAQAVVDVELQAPTAADAEPRHWLVSQTPVTLDGHVLGVSCVVQDDTARTRTRTRATFLMHAGEILDSSLDYRQTLQRVAELAVPGIADWCSISMLDERGQMRRLAVAHSDPEKDQLAQELIEREALPLDAPAGAASVMRDAHTQVIDDFSDELLIRSLNDPRSHEIVRELGLGSSISTPLIARGRMLGAISLLSARRFHFDAEDVRLAEELARRAAVSIDNARLYTQQRRIAQTLQAGLLPRALPHIPGLDLAARYRPAGELNEVGGDFYDAYLRSAGEWIVVIGDVTGKGPNAAATTALIRYTLRAAAVHPGSARDLLFELNRAMLSQDAAMCSVALLSIKLAPSGVPQLSVCLAGHPAPVLLGAGGGLTVVGTAGTLLGYTDEPHLTEVSVELSAGDILLLYTDGLTDATRPGWSDAELHDRLQATASGDLDAMLAHLEGLAVSAANGRPRDDIALLALRAAAPDGR
ncbi:MAG: SpoIIE family protein phosphatase [Solirubrobacteraceae bacterium]